ncbi:MAG: hypothetical protein DRO14_05675 [Thermoprotei archaeon]|nr:MAG: hypothetical protein DRO14_05675 [Thermoprotei archaeon]
MVHSRFSEISGHQYIYKSLSIISLPSSTYMTTLKRLKQPHISFSPPKKYQEKLKQYHGKRVKVIVIIESE